jgi:hypothetical protein
LKKYKDILFTMKVFIIDDKKRQEVDIMVLLCVIRSGKYCGLISTNLNFRHETELLVDTLDYKVYNNLLDDVNKIIKAHVRPKTNVNTFYISNKHINTLVDVKVLFDILNTGKFNGKFYMQNTGNICKIISNEFTKLIDYVNKQNTLYNIFCKFLEK